MKMQRSGRIILVAWLACLVSCPLQAENPGPAHRAPDYVIGQGDVLVISIWKDDSLTREVSVLPDGTISFPLIGTIIAENKTVAGLKRDIEKEIKRFVPEPVLSVAVKNVNSMYVYVLGRVNNPGRFFLTGNVNILQALAMAGGLTPFAEANSIKIIRTESGESSLIPFRYGDIVKGKRLEQNIGIKRGDVIVVP